MGRGTRYKMWQAAEWDGKGKERPWDTKIFILHTQSWGKQEWREKLHISPKLSDIYSYNFIQFNLRRCVCVCSFKGYISFWAATLDTTPPILLLTRTHLNSTHSLITFLFLTCRRCANFPRSSVAMSPCTFIVKYYNCRYSRRPPRCVYEYRSV